MMDRYLFPKFGINSFNKWVLQTPDVTTVAWLCCAVDLSQSTAKHSNQSSSSSSSSSRFISRLYRIQ